MKEKELDTQSAGYYAYAAARDARMRAVQCGATTQKQNVFVQSVSN